MARKPNKEPAPEQKIEIEDETASPDENQNPPSIEPDEDAENTESEDGESDRPEIDLDPPSARVASFENVQGDKGEHDRRVKLSSEPLSAPQIDDARKSACIKLDAIHGAISGKKEDDVYRELKIERMHIHALNEMHERKQGKKGFHLSDGNVELIELTHQKLKKMNKL